MAYKAMKRETMSLIMCAASAISAREWDRVPVTSSTMQKTVSIPSRVHSFASLERPMVVAVEDEWLSRV